MTESKYHHFERTTHQGEKSKEVLERELAQILNQWTPLTMHQDEINSFNGVFHAVLEELIQKTSVDHARHCLDAIVSKYTQSDPNYTVPTLPDNVRPNEPQN